MIGLREFCGQTVKMKNQKKNLILSFCIKTEKLDLSI